MNVRCLSEFFAVTYKVVSLDIHDDSVESVVFVPAVSKRRTAKVQITLYRHWKQRRRMLEFFDCANVQFTMDADVLRDNAPNNTDRLAMSAQRATVERFMRSHRPVWGVRYEESLDPLPHKLKAAGEFSLFRVQFFGGKLQTAARGYRLRHLTKRSSGP